MAKPYRIPDFKKLYPEASEEVIAVLKTTERKMQYQEYDLKTERTIVNQGDRSVTIVPSREDSYERLLEQDMQFGDAMNVEELVIQQAESHQLHRALTMLDVERELVDQLYFQELTEREIAKLLGISQNAINKRRQKILKKLRRLLKNI